MQDWSGRRLVGVVCCGVALILLSGSSCVGDIRDNVVAGGLDFVHDSVVAVLEALIPLERILAPAGP